MNFPVAAQKARVFIAVGIAQHHLLQGNSRGHGSQCRGLSLTLGGLAPQHFQVEGQLQTVPASLLVPAANLRRFQTEARVECCIARHRVIEASLFGQQQHLQHVADMVAHADHIAESKCLGQIPGAASE
jgi:hypothetical protein